MIKKIIILFSIILITIILFVCINLKETSNNAILEISSTNTENNIFSNILENTAIVTDVTNDIIENVIVENIVEKNIVTETISTPTVENNNKPTQNNNTSPVIPQSSTTTTTVTPTNKDKDENKTNTKVNTKNDNVSDKNQTTSSSDKKQDTTKQETTETTIGNPELAYSTYRKQNTSIVPEIISILKSEIAKDKELVDFGTTAVSTNKTNAYNNTTGFTYLFVKDITKGKIEGNYKSFPERVRNTVGAFGTYYVYAEDEYSYDAKGLNPKWSQTLVWIYVKF